MASTLLDAGTHPGTAVAADGLWHRIVARVREASWALDANDGIIGIAGILQGFASAGAGDRLLIFAERRRHEVGGVPVCPSDTPASATADLIAKVRPSAA
jgi:hypothetical protein